MEEIKRPDITFVELEDASTTAKKCEGILEEYKTWVETLNVDDLKEEEKKIIEIIEEYEKTLKEKTYSLGKKVVFEGHTYTKEKVFKFIQEVINKREASYQETLGLYQLYQYWGSAGDTVSYPILDSTLRTLESTPKFKGFSEWEKILVINEYFKSNNSEMTMDYLQQIYYAHIHNAIIDKLQLKDPDRVKTETESQEGPIQMD
jgi:hypothetical protein